MPRKAKKIVCQTESLHELQSLVRSKTAEFRLVERAKMVLACLNEEPIHAVASRFQASPNTVITWRDRFAQSGVCGLMDMPRSGRPPQYSTEFRETVLQLLETPPPTGQRAWNGVTIARTLKVTDDAVSRLLRKEGIRLGGRRDSGATP
ncbi:MAG: helix-turn-helix domain-containing protein [Magnetococcales bacterium]|nr:helix-turn-helix domain-containing protein [Magnetococcales bacterium]